MKIKITKLITITMLSIFLSTTNVTAYTGTANLNVDIGGVRFFINNVSATPDPPSFAIKGATYVPLRFVSEYLGYSVAWNNATNTIVMNYLGNDSSKNEIFSYTGKRTKNIDVTYQNINIVMDGKTLSPDQEPFIYNGSTYVPLRFISESMGMQVSYDAATSTVFIENTTTLEISSTTPNSTTTTNSNYQPIAFTNDEQSKIAEMTKYINENFTASRTLVGDAMYEVKPSTLNQLGSFNANNYNIGKLKIDAAKEGLKPINYLRYLAGLPADVELDEKLNETAQYGAFLLSVNNTGLNHRPKNIKSIPDILYNKGYFATDSSNLALDSYENLFYSNSMYADDSSGSNIYNVGHRVWLLKPNLKYTGIGKADIYSATVVTDSSRSPAINPEYTAFPQGLFPENTPAIFFNANSCWSIQFGTLYDSNNPKYYLLRDADIKVTLTRLNDNKVWVLDKSTKDLSGNFFNYNGGSGTIVFRPEIDDYKDGDVFTVKIENIKQAVSWTPDTRAREYYAVFEPGITQEEVTTLEEQIVATHDVPVEDGGGTEPMFSNDRKGLYKNYYYDAKTPELTDATIEYTVKFFTLK